MNTVFWESKECAISCNLLLSFELVMFHGIMPMKVHIFFPFNLWRFVINYQELKGFILGFIGWTTSSIWKVQNFPSPCFELELAPIRVSALEAYLSPLYGKMHLN